MLEGADDTTDEERGFGALTVTIKKALTGEKLGDLDMGYVNPDTSSSSILHLADELEIWAEKRGRKRSEGFAGILKFWEDTGNNTAVVLPNNALLRNIANGRNRITLKMMMELDESYIPYFTTCRKLEEKQEKTYFVALKAMSPTNYQEMLPAASFPEREPRKTNNNRRTSKRQRR